MNISQWKTDFPVFNTELQHALCYLDTAATCLVPKCVADAHYQFLTSLHANSHRGLYPLAVNATNVVENARQQVQQFMQAPALQDIIFCSGATAAINMVATSFLKHQLGAKHNIVISEAEHHANILPWQALIQAVGAELRVIKLKRSGQISLKHAATLIDENTKLVALCHVSNVTGVVNPIAKLCQVAEQKNVPVLVDGAQAALTNEIDVVSLGCDFYAFSGHKFYAGNGIGVLYAKTKHHHHFSPFLFGGGIVDKVIYEQSTFKQGLQKLEAGTLNITAIYALTTALAYLQTHILQMKQHIECLATYLAEQLALLPFIQPLVPYNKHSIVSFQMQGVHGHDIATLLAEHNIAVRAGHHCAQPLHQYLAVKSSVRISLGIYNEQADIDKLITALQQCYQLFTRSR